MKILFRFFFCCRFKKHDENNPKGKEFLTEGGQKKKNLVSHVEEVVAD